MATLEGARALGLGEVTGSLVPGKWADLCCIDLRRAAQLAGARRRDRGVYAASSQQVTDTWVAGRRLLADGTPDATWTNPLCSSAPKRGASGSTRPRTRSRRR